HSRSFRITQAPFEETIDLLVGRLGGGMPVASGHADATVVSEQFVDSDRVVERRPALRHISGAAGDEKRPWRHQCVQFQQIVAGFNECLVGAGACLAFGGKFAKRTGVVWIGDDAWFKAQIPYVPVVNAAAGVLFAAVALVENDSGVRPDGAGKLVVK